MISLWTISVLKTACSHCHQAAALEINSPVTVDTALICQGSVTLNLTAAMAQKRGMLHVVNTTGILTLYDHLKVPVKVDILP